MVPEFPDRSPSLSVTVVRGVVLLVHSARAMGDAEWDRVVDAMWEAARVAGKVGVLVYTPGPAPNANQRLRITEVSSKYPMRVAVCTESRIARAVAAAIDWASRIDIRPYRPSEVEAACEYLEVAPEDREAVLEEFRRMRSELR